MSSLRTTVLVATVSVLSFVFSSTLTLYTKSTMTIWWPIGWTIVFLALTVAAQRRSDLWQTRSMKVGCAALLSMSLGMLAGLLCSPR